MRLILITYLFLSNCVFSQEIVDYSLSPCDVNSRVELIQPRIISKFIYSDTLFLSIGFRENCTFDLNPAISIVNDTLYLELSEPRPIELDSLGNEIPEMVIVTMCDCCFELNLSLTDIKDTNFVLMVNELQFFHHDSRRVKLPDEYIFDKSKPINQGNEDGLKIGLWKAYYEGTNKLHVETYFDEKWDDSIKRWEKVYNRKGELISVCFRTRLNGSMIYVEVKDYYKLLKTP